MRVFKLTLIAVAAIFAFSAAAEAIEVKKKGEAPGTPAEVWAVVGNFCAIKDWHPAVAECEQVEEDGETYRILTLGDGGKIKEKLTDSDDTSYSYIIIESPLPVRNYSSTLTINEHEDPNKAVIIWEGEFDADGVEDARAEEIITGIYDDGVGSIQKMTTDKS